MKLQELHESTSGFLLSVYYADHPSIPDQEADSIEDVCKQLMKKLAGAKLTTVEFGHFLILAPTATQAQVDKFKIDFEAAIDADNHLQWNVDAEQASPDNIEKFRSHRTNLKTKKLAQKSAEKEAGSVKLEDREFQVLEGDADFIEEGQVLSYEELMDENMFDLSKAEKRDLRKAKVNDEVETYSEAGGMMTLKRIK
jgi:hypothetical protein